MAKIVLNDVTNTYSPITLNALFTQIENEFQNKVLYRDNPVGEVNTLATDVDVNSRRLYNLAAPVAANDAVRLTDLNSLNITSLSAAGSSFAPTGNISATTVQTAIVESDTENRALSANAAIQVIAVACSDETTSLTTGTSKVTFRMPYAFTLTKIKGSVTTAATGATLLTVNVKKNGTTVFSTKMTFDASEKTTATAATPSVLSITAFADDDEITIDIDAVGNTLAGAGLKLYFIGTKI